MNKSVTLQEEEPVYYVNPYYNLNYILSTPAMTVPALTDEDIEVSVLQAIIAYFEGDMPFDILIGLAETIQLFMGMRENRYDLSDMLGKIKRLDIYKDDPASAKEVIDDTLFALFQELTVEPTK